LPRGNPEKAGKERGTKEVATGLQEERRELQEKKGKKWGR